MLLRQKVFLGVVIPANALLWIIPSDVVELVARDRHTLLGRYSREHFSWIVGVLIISVIGLYIDWAPARKRRKRSFQIIAGLLFLVPSIAVVDYLARSPQPGHYVRDSLAYHRRPNETFTVDFADRPEARRTYPHSPKGFGTVKCIYHTDARGFRNRHNQEQYDIVVLGDSFAEGSGVSDEDPWPVKLAGESRLSVLNLGMSGYGPVNYLASLQEYGSKLSPGIVLCMLYEGNDFRSDRSSVPARGATLSSRLKRYFKQSPIRNAIDGLFVEYLGPIACERDLAGLDVLSWLPLAIPDGAQANYYAFAPKQLLQSYVSEEKFRQSKQWRSPADVLSEMNKLCRSAGAELIIVFAPTKAHVVMPLVRDGLPADKVHAFASLRSDKLPPPGEFVANLYSRLAARESVVRQWCRREGVPYIDTTPSLRRHISAGRQVYYTYNQHWTPIGHDVVAETVSLFLLGIGD